MAAWDSIAPYLACPRCESRLTRVGGTLRCRRLHSFDIARGGHANFLPPGRRGARPFGDVKEMVLARRRFLERGYYSPLAEAISALAWRCLATHAGVRSWCIVDAGCGEGFYLDRLRQHVELRAGGAGLACLGLDISRDAITLAARRYPALNFLVADARSRLPCRAASAHLLLNMFAPRNPREFGRIVAPGGFLIVVIPTPGHLAQLRTTFSLIGMQADKRNRIAAAFRREFTLVETLELEYEIVLDTEALSDLVWMTPNAWHLASETEAKLRQCEQFQTTAGFDVLLFRKGKSPT